MNLFGIHISIYSGLWWCLGSAVAYLIICGFCWCMCAAAGNADELAGRK